MQYRLTCGGMGDIMNKKTVVSILENAFMVFLLLAMLVQCVLYISFAQNNGDGSLPVFPESEVRLLANDSSMLTEAGRSFVAPYFVGAISEDAGFGGAYEDSLAYEVFGCFADVLENAAGGTCKKVVYSGTDKKYEYLDNLYGNTKNCYYVRLKNGIEFSVLCQLMSDTYTELPENPDFIITDMFLVSGSMGESSITAVDPYGNVLKIFPSKNISFNNEYLEAYNNTEKDEFEFVKIHSNAEKDRNCYFPAFKYSVAYKSLIGESFSQSFDVDADSPELRSFVSIFGMNNDNTRFYKRSSDGAIICVEDTTSLEINPDGNFVFLPEDGGEALGVFLENGDDANGFYDYSSVAQNIVAKINERLVGYCAKLSLDDVTYSNGECSFKYSYTVNGIPIEKGESSGFELRFASDRLMYAQGTLRTISFFEDERTEIPQKTAYVLMEETESPVVYFGPEYCFESTGEDSETAFLRWMVETENIDGRVQE